jgi:hypothetical protein
MSNLPYFALYEPRLGAWFRMADGEVQVAPARVGGAPEQYNGEIEWTEVEDDLSENVYLGEVYRSVVARLRAVEETLTNRR